jgi:hypothetical protein
LRPLAALAPVRARTSQQELADARPPATRTIADHTRCRNLCRPVLATGSPRRRRRTRRIGLCGGLLLGHPSPAGRCRAGNQHQRQRRQSAGRTELC